MKSATGLQDLSSLGASSASRRSRGARPLGESAGSRREQGSREEPRKRTSFSPSDVARENICHAVLMAIVSCYCWYVLLWRPFRTMNKEASASVHVDPSVADHPRMTEDTPLKPWESTPPKPIPLHSVADSYIRQRHQCIANIRERHLDVLGPVLDSNDYLLVDPAYHANVGDHMNTLAEQVFLHSSLNPTEDGTEFNVTECHYVQSNFFVDLCSNVIAATADNDNARVALWHGGGNWGDLWREAQISRIASLETLLKANYQILTLPQSLYYQDKSLEAQDAAEIERNIAKGLDLPDLKSPKARETAKASVVFTWREEESLQQAEILYPFARHLLVPLLSFQLGPYAPIRSESSATEFVDILFFLRNDLESLYTQKRSAQNIERLVKAYGKGNSTMGLPPTFRVVDWPDRMEIFGIERDIYFTDTAIRLLSLGKVVICDRLHAAVLSYLSGIPFVYVDQLSGKISKVLRVAFSDMEECQNGNRGRWSQAKSLSDAIQKATKMIGQYGL